MADKEPKQNPKSIEELMQDLGWWEKHNEVLRDAGTPAPGVIGETAADISSDFDELGSADLEMLEEIRKRAVDAKE